ncbi:MAG: glycolate oxidase iron-sulfur subunit [Halioglobus sp.]|jgi:glycolate oxidase iron-sulfur subunit
MKTDLHATLSNDARAIEATDIIKNCVHCGFCMATCPTYQELGDERDSPRGRIDLIKQLLEEGSASDKTRTHLDRCLSCRSCETTCPSGVDYGRLLDIGRHVVEEQQQRTLIDRVQRRALLWLLPYPKRFTLALRLGQFFAPILPRFLRQKIPSRQRPLSRPSTPRTRVMLALAGCAQPGATPNTNAATARVLDRLEIQLLEPKSAGCCGAMSHHLSAHKDALDFARRNIDAWWPAIEAGAEAIIATASGCGTMVKDYGALLAEDPAYAAKSAKVSELAKDLSEIFQEEDLSTLQLEHNQEKTAIHCPCSLQHAQQLPNTMDAVLSELGFNLVSTTDGHLCCGSAGTYSILQPALSEALLDNKLAALSIADPAQIVTANIGCQMHLASKSILPVRHWIEIIDEAIT